MGLSYNLFNEPRLPPLFVCKKFRDCNFRILSSFKPYFIYVYRPHVLHIYVCLNCCDFFCLGIFSGIFLSLKSCQWLLASGSGQIWIFRFKIKCLKISQLIIRIHFLRYLIPELRPVISFSLEAQKMFQRFVPSSAIYCRVLILCYCSIIWCH